MTPISFDIDYEKYRNDCLKLLFRHKIPRYAPALLKVFEHYDGLEDFLELNRMPEIELYDILKYQYFGQF